MNGDPAKLPSMTDAKLALGEQALTRMLRSLYVCGGMRARNQVARCGDVLEWAQAAYDVLTGFLSNLELGNVDTELERWLPYLRALVQRDDGG